MEQEKGFIKYAVIIVVILTVVFLSQQAYTRAVGQSLISDATSQASSYLSKGTNIVTSKVLPKITGLPAQAGGVANGGEAIKTATVPAKNIPAKNTCAYTTCTCFLRTSKTSPSVRRRN